MAFLRRPRPFSLSVLSPAESVSGRLTPAISRARAGRAAGNRPERAKAARERRERRFIQNLLRGVDSTGTRGHFEGRSRVLHGRRAFGAPRRPPRSAPRYRRGELRRVPLGVVARPFHCHWESKVKESKPNAVAAEVSRCASRGPIHLRRPPPRLS